MSSTGHRDMHPGHPYMAQDKGPLFLEQTPATGYFGAVRSREKLQCAEHVCASELEPNLIDPASDHICYPVQLPLHW